MAQRTLSRRSRRDDDYDDEPRGRGRDVDPRDDDDDDYEAPRRGRSRRRDDDYDEPPARGRSRRREPEPDDDEDEEPPAAARGRSRRSRDEDDRPSRGRSRSRRDEEDDEPPARSRRRGRDEEETRRPRGRGRDDERGPRRGANGASSSVGRGWKGYDSIKNLGGDWVRTWTVPKKPTLIKFLDEEPFSVYNEHWLDEQKGRKSFICLGDDCPLCDELGDRPSKYALFNILDLTDPDNPKVEVWKTGKRVGNILKEYGEDRKTAPLNREDLYWSIFKSGEKGGNVQTNIMPVKARDLVEDWDCDPFTEDELEEFEEKLHTEEQIITISPRKELRAIAASYED